MAIMVQNYQLRCQETQTEPDGELLEPIIEVLERLSRERPEDTDDR
jgi:hypothetical protein